MWRRRGGVAGKGACVPTIVPSWFGPKFSLSPLFTTVSPMYYIFSKNDDFGWDEGRNCQSFQ